MRSGGQRSEDHHHQATTAIAEWVGRVVVEKSNVAGIMTNRRLPRAIADFGMSDFSSKLEYKRAWYGTNFEKSDRWFAATQQFIHCGWKDDGPKFSNGEWW